MNPGSEIPAENPGLTPANLGLRLLAFLADMALFAVVQFVVLILSAYAVEWGLPWNGFIWFVLAAGFLFPFLYLGWANAGGRQSPGKAFAGLQVVNVKGQPVGIVVSVLHTFITLICTFWCCLGVPFLSAFLPARRTVPDYLVKSKVVTSGVPCWPRLLAMVVAQPILLVVFLLSNGAGLFPLQTYYILSGAMEPTLQFGDRLLTSRLTYNRRDPRPGEIVVFKAPKAALEVAGTTEADDFIKRCVGVPGDVIEMHRAKLYRNGKLVHEPYVIWQEPPVAGLPATTYAYDMKVVNGQVYSREYVAEKDIPGLWTQKGIALSETEQKVISAAKPGKVPPDMFLMLGDHRNNSNDSHIWGFMPRNLLVARVFGIYWPFGRESGL